MVAEPMRMRVVVTTAAITGNPMSETYASAPVADDIVDDGFDRPSALLDRAADRILLEDAARERRRVDSLRRAMAASSRMAREWGRARAEQARLAVETEPMKATLYALGAGVVLGLLLRR